MSKIEFKVGDYYTTYSGDTHNVSMITEVTRESIVVCQMLSKPPTKKSDFRSWYLSNFNTYINNNIIKPVSKLEAALIRLQIGASLPEPHHKLES